jgi:general stress protein YciG
MKKKDPAAVALGKKGGKARAKALSPERRSEIAKKAVTAREAKRNTKQ